MDVKKHKNNVDYIRESITIYWTGIPADSTGTTMFLTAIGSIGPTMFLLSGKSPRRGFNFKFLIKYGAAMVSVTIIMEIAYMTTKSWEYMTQNLRKRYRNFLL